MVDILGFVQRYLYAENTGDTALNRGQCVGLVEIWLDENKLPHIWGNAADLLKNADSNHYRVVVNGPVNFPAPGDIICWNTTWGSGAGHTAIVLVATSYHLVVFEQNNPEGSPPAVSTHDYRGIEGWLSFRI